MKSFLFAAIFILLFCNVSPEAANASPEEPVRIILNEWTSQVVLSKITGKIFTRMGYPVEYQRVDSHRQWGGLHRGYYHVQVEVWEGTQKEVLERVIKKGGILQAGTHDAITREDWWYPTYVEESCPGLPDWKALKSCYGIFATPETSPRGMYITGPWDKTDRIRIRALDLKFEVVHVENAEVLRSRLKEAVRKRKPILILNWTPDWVEAHYEGKFVEFPPYAPECETNPGWGINPDDIQDCGAPRNGWLKKAVWAGMKERWPCAFETFKNLNFSNMMISELALKVDIGGMSPDDAAETWILENKALWESWIPLGCEKKGL